MRVDIWTDGACSHNGAKNAIGGWAFIIFCTLADNSFYKIRCSKRELNATNNKMEMLAIVEALNYYKNTFYTFCEGIKQEINLYTDSAYIVNCFKNKWYQKWIENGWRNSKGESVANNDYWKQIISFCNIFNINFIKVAGHSYEEINNEVDRLAVLAKTSGSNGRDLSIELIKITQENSNLEVIN